MSGLAEWAKLITLEILEDAVFHLERPWGEKHIQYYDPFTCSMQTNTNINAPPLFTLPVLFILQVASDGGPFLITSFSRNWTSSSDDWQASISSCSCRILGRFLATRGRPIYSSCGSKRSHAHADRENDFVSLKSPWLPFQTWPIKMTLRGSWILIRSATAEVTHLLLFSSISMMRGGTPGRPMDVFVKPAASLFNKAPTKSVYGTGIGVITLLRAE